MVGLSVGCSGEREWEKLQGKAAALSMGTFGEGVGYTWGGGGVHLGRGWGYPWGEGIRGTLGLGGAGMWYMPRLVLLTPGCEIKKKKEKPLGKPSSRMK